MSGADQPAPPVRPATARARQDDALDEGATPPSRDELAGIERDRIGWTILLGAEVEEDAALGVTIVSHAGRGSGLNFAARIRWREHDATDRLSELDARTRAAGVWPQVVVSDGLTEPADLPDRLRDAGWLPIGSERFMWTRHPVVVPHLDPGLRIEAVTTATALECARLETTNFGLDPDALGRSAELLGRAIAAGATRAFLVRLAREPIASARLVPGSDGICSLHAIGVAERHRRRGYGRLITAVATRAGLATGHRLVWLSVDEANVAAVELYRSLGFALTLDWSRWIAPAR